MKSHLSRIGRLSGAAALVAFAPVAHAQQGTPTPTPRPAPPIITLPGANQFDLRPSGSQPTARPTAQPTPRPTPTPAVPVARVTPTPRPTAKTAARPTPAPTRPAVTPTPVASPTAQPDAEDRVVVVTGIRPLPAPALTSTPTPVPAPPATGQGIPWLWILIGAAMAAVLVALGWLLGRRRQAPQPAEKPVPVAPPRPVPQPAAAPPPPPPAPRPAPRPAAPADPIVVELRPIAIALSDNGAVLDFEIVVGNATNAQADALRVAYGLMSASQIQDELIAGFHATQLPPVADPFDLAPRAGVRIPGQLALAPDKINIVDVGGRPMFVAILMVDVRWRSGLSLKHQGYDFMVGMGGPGDKLGPIWLDKGAQRHERLNATRYFPKPVQAAAE